MKNKLLKIVLVCFISELAHAQLNVPDVKSFRPVLNAAMVIQVGGQKLEVLPNSRAVQIGSAMYSITNSDSSENITKDRLGVAYSYAINSNILLNGEITIKLKNGNTVSSLGSLGTGLKSLVPPSVFVMNANTPSDLVRWVNLLQAHPAVEWVEPFTVKARVN
jgi:hypothetical protein